MADKPEKTTQASEENAPKDPMIKVAGVWIPAHEAWARMEIVTEVTDKIERFNNKFPNLSTESTREVVPVVRQRMKDVALRMPRKAPDAPDFATRAGDLLDQMSPEEVLDNIQEEFGESLSLRDLISLAGEAAYIGALIREAQDYRANAILPEQTAQIWNDMARPAPGGGLW